MADMNYYDAFIAVADDCPANSGMVPELFREKETIATIQWQLLNDHPYQLTQEDVLFQTEWIKEGKNPLSATQKERDEFFARPRACLRSSPLGKKYGWGLHFDNHGKIALYSCSAVEYNQLKNDPHLTQTKAMNTKRQLG